MFVAFGDRIRFADWFGAGDKWRKRLKQLVKHLASREQLLDRNANLDAIVAGLFEGNIVAVSGHLLEPRCDSTTRFAARSERLIETLVKKKSAAQECTLVRKF